MGQYPNSKVDPTGGKNPVYDQSGDFLGTDDQGLQGEAIVMNASDFTQGMSHADALSNGTLFSNLPMVYMLRILFGILTGLESMKLEGYMVL
jgi:hypothetical protein